MNPISVAQMVEVDRLMIHEFGIELLQMMENAGRGLAEVARLLLGGNLAGRTIIVLVGKGNNGGGGLVAARHLVNAGALVTVALAIGGLGDAPEHQRHALARMDVPGSEGPTDAVALPRLLDGVDLVLDALIGYSLRGAPREPMTSFIRAANASPALILALDIPSGLPGDRGVPFEPTIKAGATLTLAWPKSGLLAEAARSFVGELYLADISVPAAVYRAVGVDPDGLFARGPIVRVRPTSTGWEPA